MNENILGPDYHNRIRKILTVDDKLLPNRIIDASLNIGAMKRLIETDVTESHQLPDSQQKREAMLQYLAGVICMALKSRTAVAPYCGAKYKKNWDKKRKKCMERGNKLKLAIEDSLLPPEELFARIADRPGVQPDITARAGKGVIPPPKQ